MNKEEIKQLITEAKNICLIPKEDEPESLTAALALFYTLKELHKNVNLIIADFPEKFSFLIPSLDFISQPKNFVISIPRQIADVSQIYYEKNEDNLKIHLTIDKGNIKKDNISFYFSQAKPDLAITLGIQDFQNQLAGRLDSFGFLLDAPIINIDNVAHNKKFGKVNIIEKKSLSEILHQLLVSLDPALITKNTASCLLAGLVVHYENFKSSNTNPTVLKMAAELMEKGAEYQGITQALYKTTQKQMDFLAEIFKHLNREQGLYVSELPSDAFLNFGKQESADAVEKIKTLGLGSDLLVLWKSHASAPAIKGFFYSTKQDILNKISRDKQFEVKNDWAHIVIPGEDINTAKQQVLNLIA